MSGIFGFGGNFEKPGRGVRKDEKRKQGMSLFFELFFRKFASYVKLNLLYFLTCIPTMVLLTFLSFSLVYDLAGESAGQPAAIISLLLSVYMVMIFGLSPFSSGFYYVLRNFSEERHSWVASDFFRQFKNNIGKSLITFLIDLVFAAIVLVALRVYLISFAKGSYAMVVPFIVFILVSVFYANSVSYRWTQIVTLDLKLPAIYKNSFLLCLGELKTTLINILWSGVFVVVLMFLTLKFPGVGFTAVFLFGFSVYGLIQQLNFYDVFRKYFTEGKTVEQALKEQEEEK